MSTKMEVTKEHVMNALTEYLRTRSLIGKNEEVTWVTEGNRVFYVTVGKED